MIHFSFRCIQLDGIDKASQALHLACLLIPQKALATLCYLLQVFLLGFLLL